MGDLLLGIDAGLTAIKAVLFDRTGQTVAVARVATPLVADSTGRSEINMTAQWQATCRAIRSALEQAGTHGGQIAGVGVSGHGNGAYLLDRDGAALGPAISSMDHRGLPSVNAFAATSRAALRDLTFQTLWSGQPGMILRWLRQHEPARYRQISSVLFCKDWLRYCLTGVLATDLTDASASGLYAIRPRAYDPAIFDLLEIPEAGPWLPQVRPSDQVSGAVQAAAAQQTGLAAGTPVVAGLFDVTANALGAGLVDEGRFCAVGGTWSLNIALSRQPRVPVAIRQCTIYADEALYSLIDSSATSAANLEWFLRRVLGDCVTYADFEHALMASQPAETMPLFLPLVYGGLRDDDPGASFLGLRSSHGRGDLLRAIAEGIAFAHRYHIESLRREGLSGDRVLFTGGASRSRPLCQTLTDVLQQPVTTPAAEETGALGAAIVAAIGIGAHRDVKEAVAQLVHERESFLPDAIRGETYARRYKRFLDALDWLSGTRSAIDENQGR
ncbi:MAG: carbohydrate kinase [Anaerolineae bacterium]|nr:carbohydrate kinase [Anaerolineae bacterium]